IGIQLANRPPAAKPDYSGAPRGQGGAGQGEGTGAPCDLGGTGAGDGGTYPPSSLPTGPLAKVGSMSLLERVLEETERYLPEEDRLTPGTGTGLPDVPEPLPQLGPGIPLYDVTLACIDRMWG